MKFSRALYITNLGNTPAASMRIGINQPGSEKEPHFTVVFGYINVALTSYIKYLIVLPHVCFYRSVINYHVIEYS